MKQEKTKKIKLRDRLIDNDIKYRGPLSYRYLRIFGWVFLILGSIATIMKFNMRLVPESTAALTPGFNFFNYFSDLPLPLFLIANFAAIMQKKDNMKRLLIFYGGVAALLYLVANIIVIHYYHGIANALVPGTPVNYTCYVVGHGLAGSGRSAYTFNIFIDLFLCSISFFFINYTPTKIFKGKWIIAFRLLVLIPIAYEISTLVIKYYMTMDLLMVPSYFFFLLPGKPPFMFFAFVVLIVLLKIIEVRHKKKYGEEHFIEHSKTNAYSLRVAIRTSIVFAIMSILDLIVSVITIALILEFNGIKDITQDAVFLGLLIVQNMGLIGGVVLMSTIPFILLFDFQKTHKNKLIDTVIPIVGVGLVVFTYVEGIFEVFAVNLQTIMGRVFGPKGGEEEPQQLIQLATSKIKEIVSRL